MIYFDNSSTTNFKPDSVINAVANTLKFVSANPGRASHSLAMKAARIVQYTREKAARFFNAEFDRVCFNLNCTDALNQAILGTVKRGGHVITTVYEHNSVLRPLHELEAKGLIRLSILKPTEFGAVTAQDVERAITPDTYLVAINHVSNVTGAVSPISSIGAMLKKHDGIYFLVDGAQSAGYLDVNLKEQNIDMLSVSPHKGLHGPQGVGVLALSERVSIKPTRYGGTGTSSASPLQPDELPESLESGTLPTPTIAGLNAAIGWTEKNSLFVRKKLSELSSYFKERFNSLKGVTVYTPKNSLNGMFSFNINTLSSMEVSDILSDQYDIAIRAGLHCAPLIHKHLNTVNTGIIRVSMGFENTYSQIDEFIKAIDEISRSA